jgi:hypothetical protein
MKNVFSGEPITVDLRTQLMIAAGIIGLLVNGCGGSGGSAPPPSPPPPPPMTIVTHSTTFKTAGFPFEAVVSSTGSILVSVTSDGSNGSATGVQVFAPLRRDMW